MRLPIRAIVIAVMRLVLIFTCLELGATTLAAQSNSTVRRSPEVTSNSYVTGENTGPEVSQRDARYRLRPGDTLELEFAFSPEFNQTVVVGPDGFVTFRGVGSWKIEGQTLPDVTEMVTNAYSGILNQPVVTLTLKDFEKPYFIAAGQVAKPGKYELRSDLSLVEAINVAGGFTEESKHSQVLLFRRVSSDRVEARVYDVKKMISSHNLDEDPALKPGDMVLVPQNKISKIRRYLPTSSLGLYANPLVP